MALRIHMTTECHSILLLEGDIVDRTQFSRYFTAISLILILWTCQSAILKLFQDCLPHSFLSTAARSMFPALLELLSSFLKPFFLGCFSGSCVSIRVYVLLPDIIVWSPASEYGTASNPTHPHARRWRFPVYMQTKIVVGWDRLRLSILCVQARRWAAVLTVRRIG